MTTLTEPPRVDIPPRHDVLRTAPFALRAEDGADPDDGRTLDGWAAVFNRETIIDSWEGKFRESIRPGSMKRSFRDTPPRIQFDHGRHPLVGSIPIAALRSIAEETHAEHAPEGGAHVIGRLLDNWLVEPVRDAIAAQAISGMSFRFEVLQETWYDADGKQIRDEEVLRDLLRRTWYEDVPDDELLLRELRQLKVPELGPVVWPAYGETSVEVRDAKITLDLGRLDDPEQRKTLARAVFLADAAERMEADETQPATEDDESPAGEHEGSADDDEQRATEADEAPADEHPESDETPAGSPAPIRFTPAWGERPAWYLD